MICTLIEKKLKKVENSKELKYFYKHFSFIKNLKNTFLTL